MKTMLSLSSKREARHRANQRAKRRPSFRQAPAAEERRQQPVWRVQRLDGVRVRLCAHHLLQDPDLSDAMPAEGLCERCTELVSPTSHAVSRWQERVAPGSATEAGLQILAFVANAYTVERLPRWARCAPAPEIEVLLNDRWEQVALLKRWNGRPIILTVLTQDDPA